MSFKVAEAEDVAGAGAGGNSRHMRTLIDTGFLRADGNYIHGSMVENIATSQQKK